MPGRQMVFVATGQRIAGELLGKFYDELDSIPPALQIKLKKRSAEVCQFPNNARIWSLPSAEPGAIRGLGMRGTATDVYIDEYAHVPNDYELWVVVHDFQILGGKTVLNSTPKGQRGKYYEVADPLQAELEQEKRIPLGEWSYHQIHFKDCPRLRNQEKALKSSMTDMDFLQEYGNRFIDESVSFFPYKLIWDCQTVKELVSSGHTTKNPILFGIDFGKRVSETIIYITEEVAPEKYKTLWVEILPGVDYPNQIEVIKQLNKIFDPSMINVDASGPGGQAVYDFMAKETELEGKLWGYNLSSTFKEKIIIRVRVLMQQKRFGLPTKETFCGEKIEMQLHSIMRQTTKSGQHTRYSGKESGMDDIVWAMALSVYKEHVIEFDPMLEVVQDETLQRLTKERKRKRWKVVREWEI